MIHLVPSDQIDLLVQRNNNFIMIDMSYCSTTHTSYLSPYYSWGNIPVPFSTGLVAESVMSIWEGLKVFEYRNIDLNILSLKNLISRDLNYEGIGNLIGYRKGRNYDYIYDENEAYQRLFIPSYRWILENKAYKMVHWLRFNIHKNIVLVDNFKEVIPNQMTPASLLKAYVLGSSPFQDIIQKRISHHSALQGSKHVTWHTEEYYYKTIPPIESESKDGIIEFDFRLSERISPE